MYYDGSQLKRAEITVQPLAIPSFAYLKFALKF